jgi:hypothetical protein
VLVAAGLAGWSVAALASAVLHRGTMPVPQLERPRHHVVIDRTLSEVPLFTGAFADDREGRGYGMLEQWIPRVGNYISRRTGDEVFRGEAIVVVCPTRSVPKEYRERLVQFVESGGRLLVLDAPDVQGTTANSLLWPFGLVSLHAGAPQNAGPLTWVGAADLPELELQAACAIDGGQPIAHVGQTPVAAQVRHGQGLVTAVGFASLFNDAAMGYHWLPEPQEPTLRLYEVLYHLLRVSLPCEPIDR